MSHGLNSWYPPNSSPLYHLLHNPLLKSLDCLFAASFKPTAAAAVAAVGAAGERRVGAAKPAQSKTSVTTLFLRSGFWSGLGALICACKRRFKASLKNEI